MTEQDLKQEIRRLSDRIRVLNGTVDNLKQDCAGKMKIIRDLQALISELAKERAP